jgi:putative transposase
VDKEEKTVDFLLTARRYKAAALRFFEKAMKASGAPEKVTMDKSRANKAAMNDINGRGETSIIVRQVKYLNNIVEQDHRAIKRVTRPMLNFKSFRAARNVLAGIELMHMIRKGQLMLQSCKAAASCRLPTSFMHWQDKSVLFEGLTLAPVKITFVSG